MTILLDKERELRLTNRKITRLERLFEAGITRILELLSEFQFIALIKVIYVCIEYGKDEKELTLKDVEDFVFTRKDAGCGDDWIKFYGQVLGFMSDELRNLKIFSDINKEPEKKTELGGTGM